MARIRTTALVVAVALAAAVGLIFAGRASIDTDAAHRDGYRTGHSDGYFDGLRVGEAQGRQEGRALQEGQALPADDRQAVQHAFNAGYTAGTNDVFTGYDGGWAVSVPYVVILEQGSGQITYRIRSRVPIAPGVNYYLCADGHELCQEPRH